MILKGREDSSPSPVFPAGCLGFPSVSGLLSPSDGAFASAMKAAFQLSEIQNEYLKGCVIGNG